MRSGLKRSRHSGVEVLTGPQPWIDRDLGQVGEVARRIAARRNLADGGARLRCDAMWRDAAAAARELVTNVNDAAGEVDVVPAETEHLREAYTRVGAGDEQRPEAPRTSGEKPGELFLVRTRWSERSGCGRSSCSRRWNGCVAM